MPTQEESLNADIAHARRLVNEGRLARESFIDQAMRNDMMFTGRIQQEDIPARGHSYLLINKTGQAIITHAQIMLESRPRRMVTARETRIEPEYWLTRRALRTVQKAMADLAIPAAEEGGEDDLGLIPEDELVQQPTTETEGFDFALLDEPGRSDQHAFRVSEAFFQRVSALTQPGAVSDPRTGQPAAPLLRAGRDIFTLDDTMTAKIVNNNLDIAWDIDDRDAWLTDNVVNTKKFGMQGSMYAYDKDEQRGRCFDVHIKNLFLPKTCTGIRDAEFVIVREFVSKEEAKERWPEADAEIEKMSGENTTGGTLDAPWVGVEFDRKMIWVWHVWQRNYRYPMSPDDALAMGRVVLKRVPTGALKPDGQQEMKSVYLLTDEEFNVTDEEVTPEDKKWPKRRGIRQQQFLGTDLQVRVDDGECPYWDIPVVLNRNIPLSYQPFGQGEPERLWFIQKMIDKLASIIIDHLTYFRSPQQIYPISVYKRLKGVNMLHSYPGRDAVLDDATFDRYTEFFQSGRGFNVEVPSITTSGYVDLWQLAMQIHDQLSNNAPVLQGESPGANASGKKVQLLQQSARGVIAFGSAQLEQMLRNLTRLEIDAMRKWMPLRMWERMNDSVPPEILEAARIRSRKMDFDLKIEVVSGSGQLREQKKVEAINEVSAGLRSPQSYRRVAEIEEEDPDWQPAVPQQGLASAASAA